MSGYILSVDQGTTSSRCMIFNEKGASVGTGNASFRQYYPQPGWVEHDPEDIFASVVTSVNQALDRSGLDASSIAAIGITNQRETTVIWDRLTGIPICNAIVWQCRRTAGICEEWKNRGFEPEVREKTGLVIDAYFSAGKIRWILENISGARAKADAGNLMFGTIDTWLVYKLTGGQSHCTDYSNASRTMIFNTESLSWDEELCGRFEIPMTLLPKALPSCSEFGVVASGIPGLERLRGVRITGIAGDQPAALFGQMCIHEGDIKNTYGTGCFTLMNTGGKRIISKGGLLTSAAWSYDGRTVYALEGSVFHAGSIISWLKDEMKLITTPKECDELAESVEDSGGVFLVPAFSGLGAPYWDMYARGCLIGMTRGSGRAHVARAAIESIAYQVFDLVELMKRESGYEIRSLKADGGVSVSGLLMQLQADLIGVPVLRSREKETTSQGAAFLAGLTAGVWNSLDEVAALWAGDRVFEPSEAPAFREERIRGWRKAVSRASNWEEPERFQTGATPYLGTNISQAERSGSSVT
ncbi:MAG: glycerol kinase GlpK [Clostridiaceae bacterium]|nr:glycerol kinase GlpK [Oscillospiraceae bacterium]NLO62050.1 glycerol kinase GlpK [Clostridiaceae bacterium]